LICSCPSSSLTTGTQDKFKTFEISQIRSDIKEVENTSRVPPVMLLPLLTSAAYDYICDGCMLVEQTRHTHSKVLKRLLEAVSFKPW